jgi:SAM-dependent methyltransferase
MGSRASRARQAGRTLATMARTANVDQVASVLRRHGAAGTARKLAAALRTPPAGRPAATDGVPEGWPEVLRRGQVPDGAIDVRELLTRYSVEDLAEAAEQYFQANSGNPDYFYAKPLFNVDEAPDHLTCFAQMLGVLRPLPGMRVLDFGAGTCWTSRALSQLGCDVVATDVSPTALKFGEELYRLQPPAGETLPPRFFVFDGHKLDLPDTSVDRILCFDSFHHLPNQAEVLGEWARVLLDGGIVGLSEPGPRHSLTGQSQFEMRNYRIIENDVVLPEVAGLAAAAGFTRTELTVFQVQPFTVSLDEYVDFLSGGATGHRYLDQVRDFAGSRYNFFLYKGDVVMSDSRDRRGLLADLRVQLDATEVSAGRDVAGRFTARNTGTNRWITTGEGRGVTQLGVHLFAEDGRLLDRDYARVPFVSPRGVAPGDQVSGAFRLPAPAPGRYRLVFDVVSEFVAWFEINGAAVVDVPLAVSAP